MSNAQAPAPKTRPQPHLSDERLVAQRVLEQLGRPANLYRVNAEKLWGNQFRVNVYCSEDTDRPVKPVKMTDSFFVTLTDDAITSVPPITRKY